MMNLKSSILFASRIIFPKSGKKSIGAKSLIGAVLCIALSLIPLIVVLCVSDGVVEGMTERIVKLSSGHLQAEFNFIDEDKIDDTVLDICLKNINEIPEVTSAYKIISSTGLVASGKGRCGATVRAIEPEVFNSVDSYKKYFSSSDGNIESFYSLKGKNALIGKEIAEKLNLKSGDSIRLITTQKINGNIVPRLTSYKISAVISCGYQELDALWVFIPFSEGLKLLTPENSSVSILVESEKSLNDLFELQQKIDDAVMYSASTYRWDELNKSQYENFASTKMLLLFIMMLIVLVATVNISSCLVMISMERRKEIAILKSFGTAPGDISNAFILTGLGIGLAGIITGVPVGILVSLNINGIIWFIEKIVNLVYEGIFFIINHNLSSFTQISLMNEAYYLESIPVHIPVKSIILFIAATLVLSLFASLIPSLKAGKEKPIETFRKAGS